MAISQAKLQFWAEHGYNVCISGRHGVGKTSQVVALFNERYGKLGTDWLYFSASTMDPWVDFIGVPKEKVSADGVTYLDLVRPEMFARDNVKAIFLDEYNRAPKKVRNAVMELIQFKSINGHRFETLEVVWTAINPPEDEDENEIKYDVDEIDPAQLDRFHVFVDVPYSVSKPYFKNKYGSNDGPAAVEWWTSLPTKMKDLVSPRRLDYAIDMYQKGGDLKDVLPKEVNTSQLLLLLSEGSIKEKLAEMRKENDVKAIRKKLSEDNFYTVAIEVIMKNNKDMKYFIPKCPHEKITALIGNLSKPKLTKMLDALDQSEETFNLVTEIVNAGTLTKAKMKTLQDWRIKNFADSLGDEIVMSDLTEIADEAGHNAWSENTYYRKKTMAEITDEVNRIPRNAKVPLGVAKDFYFYMIVALVRSQGVTFNHFRKRWYGAMKKMHKHHPFEETVKKLGNKLNKRTMEVANEHLMRYDNKELNNKTFE